MTPLRYVPDAVLQATYRVLGRAPSLTWRWRIAIFVETTRRFYADLDAGRTR